jgi:glycosyltransferase involved in cell wall biosynthesis
VLHVLNNPAGGSAESALALIEDLRREGIESAAVCHATGSPAAMAVVREAVEGRLLVTRLWWWNRRTRAVWWRRPLADVRESVRTGRGRWSARRVGAWARDQQVDLVHTNTILVPEGASVARALDLPHVWHLRELIGPGHPFRFWNERHFVTDRVAGGCDVLVANSRSALAAIADRLPDDLAQVIPNGIDTTAFAAIPDPHDGPEPLVVGMVANLTSTWKQHDLFVEAAARIDPAAPVRFVLIGHDPVLAGERHPYAESVHALVERAGLTDRFEFAGYVEEPTLAMARIDVLVHPCAQESFGRVAIEAMAAGRPVVGVDAGGIGEVVEHDVTGLLVAPGDTTALAAAVERLARDPAARRRLGGAGRTTAQARYQRTVHADAVIAAYELASLRHRAG